MKPTWAGPFVKFGFNATATVFVVTEFSGPEFSIGTGLTPEFAQWMCDALNKQAKADWEAVKQSGRDTITKGE